MHIDIILSPFPDKLDILSRWMLSKQFFDFRKRLVLRVNIDKLNQIWLLLLSFWELLLKIQKELVEKGLVKWWVLYHVLESVAFLVFAVLIVFGRFVFEENLPGCDFLMLVAHFSYCQVNKLLENVFQTLESGVPLYHV